MCAGFKTNQSSYALEESDLAGLFQKEEAAERDRLPGACALVLLLREDGIRKK
jgi:hypothetical protein